MVASLCNRLKVSGTSGGVLGSSQTRSRMSHVGTVVLSEVATLPEKDLEREILGLMLERSQTLRCKVGQSIVVWGNSP